MSILHVKIDDPNGAIEWVAKVPKLIFPFVVRRMADIAEETIRGEVLRHSIRPNNTMRLFRSRYRISKDKYEEVGHDLSIAPHAIYVIFGTRPHAIKPKNVSFLKWEKWGTAGHPVFSRGVWHPGYIGDNYMQKASNEALSNMGRIVDEAFAL